MLLHRVPPLTDDFLISAIFSRTDVDKIKKGLSSRESTHKVLELDDIFVDSPAYKHVAEAPNVCIDAADDPVAEGNILTLVLNILVYIREQLDSSPAATLLSFTKVVVTKLVCSQQTALNSQYVKLTIMPSPSIRTMINGFSACHIKVSSTVMCGWKELPYSAADFCATSHTAASHFAMQGSSCDHGRVRQPMHGTVAFEISTCLTCISYSQSLPAGAYIHTDFSPPSARQSRLSDSDSARTVMNLDFSSSNCWKCSKRLVKSAKSASEGLGEARPRPLSEGDMSQSAVKFELVAIGEQACD